VTVAGIPPIPTSPAEVIRIASLGPPPPEVPNLNIILLFVPILAGLAFDINCKSAPPIIWLKVYKELPSAIALSTCNLLPVLRADVLPTNN